MTLTKSNSDLAKMKEVPALGDILQCWCYKLDNFKEEMLEKPEAFLVSYSAKTHPYSES